jgi:hypothetical protein
MSSFNDLIIDAFDYYLRDYDKPYKVFYELEWFSHTEEDGFVWRSNPGDKIWDWVDEHVLGKGVSIPVSEFLFSQYDEAEVIYGIEQLYLGICEADEEEARMEDEEAEDEESTEAQRKRPCECGECDVVGGSCKKQVAE